MDEHKKEIENLKTEVASLKIRIRRLENYLLENFSDPKEYIHEDNSPDELFEEARKVVAGYDRVSASLLQRRLSIGYSRAARILDQLTAAKIIGESEGSKPREVFKKTEEKNTDGKKGNDLGQELADNLNYNVLIESLKDGQSLTPSQVITLFNLAKKRDANVEKDVEDYQAPL